MTHAEMERERHWFEADVRERFVRYATVATTSDRRSSSIPSTSGQWDLAKLLAQELRDLGLTDVELTDRCYLIARIPANEEGAGAPTFGLMAHVDTAPDLSGENVRPQVIERYEGESIPLGESGYRLDPEEYPELLMYHGQAIITTDGTTLLGGDDKAGIAEIMTAASFLLSRPEIPHGEIELIFTPDEETGRGMSAFPLEKLRSACCYTLDGPGEGSVETECFHAYRVTLTFHGRAAHLGYARGKLVNAVAMAAAYAASLPQAESPEATDGRYGYYCPLQISGDAERAYLHVYVRDFEPDGMERRLETLRRLEAAVESMYPGGKIEVSEERQYANMRDALGRHPGVVEKLEAAIAETGIQPERGLIRGGTDGARLTEMGIPTPNLFSGQFNMHSRFEWVAVPAMVRAAQSVVHLARLWAEESRE